MKKYLLGVLFALAISAGAIAATAAGTVIRVDVTSVDKMMVETEPASLATLTAVVAGS